MVEPSPEHDLLAHEVVDAAFSVHRTLGPGLLESAYEQCMAYEFEARAVSFRRPVEQLQRSAAQIRHQAAYLVALTWRPWRRGVSRHHTPARGSAFVSEAVWNSSLCSSGIVNRPS